MKDEMIDLGYEESDYSGETIGPVKPKKMKTVHPTMRLHKNVPQWMIDLANEKSFKIEAIVEKVGHNVDSQYGDGKAEVTIAFHKIKKLSNTNMTKEEYLKSGDEEREKHNKDNLKEED